MFFLPPAVKKDNESEKEARQNECRAFRLKSFKLLILVLLAALLTTLLPRLLSSLLLLVLLTGPIV